VKKFRILIVIFGVVLGIFFVFNSFLGKEIVSSMVKEKFKFLHMDLKNLTFDFNSFSAEFTKGDNHVFLFGNLFPFSGIYEAKLNNLKEISKYNGKFYSKGDFSYKNALLLKGNAIFADGFGSLNLKCNGKCFGEIKGDDFNTFKLLKMLNLKIPAKIEGKNSLDVKIADKTEVDFKFFGNITKKVSLKNLKIDGKYFNNLLKIKAKNSKLKLSSLVNFSKKSLKGNVLMWLGLLKPVTLYPLKGYDKFKFVFNKGVFKMYNPYVSVIYFNTLSANINSLPSNKFFGFLGIREFFRGKVSGNVKFDLHTFNFVVSNPVLVSNPVYEKIKKYVGVKNFDVILIKGNYDKTKVNFHIIAQNQKKGISVLADGNYYYGGDYKINLEIVAENKYKFLVENKEVKLIEATKRKKNEEILVY
jgi:hypothetical protein